MAILSGNGNEKEAGDKPAFRVHTTSAKLSEKELEAFNQLSGRQGKKPAELLRDLILKAIDDDENPTNSDPIFTEIIGLRMFLVNALRPVCTGDTMEPNDYDSLIATVRETQQETAGKFAQSYRKGKAI
jgi:hypothetical protein